MSTTIDLEEATILRRAFSNRTVFGVNLTCTQHNDNVIFTAPNGVVLVREWERSLRSDDALTRQLRQSLADSLEHWRRAHAWWSTVAAAWDDLVSAETVGPAMQPDNVRLSVNTRGVVYTAVAEDDTWRWDEAEQRLDNKSGYRLQHEPRGLGGLRFYHPAIRKFTPHGISRSAGGAPLQVRFRGEVLDPTSVTHRYFTRAQFELPLTGDAWQWLLVSGGGDAWQDLSLKMRYSSFLGNDVVTRSLSDAIPLSRGPAQLPYVGSVDLHDYIVAKVAAARPPWSHATIRMIDRWVARSKPR